MALAATWAGLQSLSQINDYSLGLEGKDWVLTADSETARVGSVLVLQDGLKVEVLEIDRYAEWPLFIARVKILN